MRRGIVIPADSSLHIEERDFAGLQDYQDAVGGYIEPIEVIDPPLTIYINEEGKVLRLDLNERATIIWWLLAPHARGQDVIVGDAVMVVVDPEVDLGLVRRAGEYCVEVQLAEARGLWVAGERKFGSWLDAARFALALDSRFTFVAAVRVATV